MNTIDRRNNRRKVKMWSLLKADFRRFSLLIFALLLPLCACVENNSAKSTKKATKEPFEGTVSEEENPLGSQGLILPVLKGTVEEVETKTNADKDYSNKEDKYCLTFYEGKGINHVDKFLTFPRLTPNEEKWMGRVFSAKYDLNDDGNDEYFYYIESTAFCGTMSGCPINVYEYKNGEFRRLFKYGIITDNFFDPEKKEDWDYICIEDEKDFGWKRLRKKKLSTTFSYNGQEYIGLKPSE